MISRGRVAVEGVRPAVQPAGFAAKGVRGQVTQFSADIFADGHDRLVAWAAAWPTDDPARRREVPLVAAVNDRWLGELIPDVVGPWSFEIGAMVDRYGTWLHNVAIKLAAEQPIDLELEEGRILLEARLADTADRATAATLRKLLRVLGGKDDPAERVRSAGTAVVVDLMRRTAPREAATIVGPLPLWVDRELAGFSAWYEMFPRSEGATTTRSGNFRTAARRLRDVAAMGFDIVYLPPIHPIGESFRKGPNNSLTAAPGDPGSPWAIGS
ncbi:MAG: maltotransferase domain-containing protein, partial [Candidatus Dormibacteria bacterium]